MGPSKGYLPVFTCNFASRLKEKKTVKTINRRREKNSKKNHNE